jgi:hypothetical protein
MTNNPRIDGVSRDALTVLMETFKFSIEHGKQPTFSKGDAEFFIKQLSTMLDAPVVECQPAPFYVTQDGKMYAKAEELLASPIVQRQLAEFSKIRTPEDKRCSPELAALQSTIAQLQARVAELESARGEPVGEVGSMPGTSGFTMAAFKADEVPIGTKLFTTPPAPGAVVLPERKPDINRSFEGTDAEWYGNIAWNACLDATAALNGERK